MQDIFEDRTLKKEIREDAFIFFAHLKNAEIISIFMHDHSVAIDFQALPTAAPSAIISGFLTPTSRMRLKKRSEIKAIYGDLWNDVYDIYTTEQAVDQHIKDYLKRQLELHAIKKVLSK